MRTRFAEEYQAAPRARFGNQLDTLTELGGASPVLEITGLVPTRAECGGVPGSPLIDLIVTYEIQDPTVGPGVAVGALAEQASTVYQPSPALTGMASIAVRGLEPRVDAAATTLPDGTRVFLANSDPINAYADVAHVFEIPSLDWL